MRIFEYDHSFGRGYIPVEKIAHFMKDSTYVRIHLVGSTKEWELYGHADITLAGKDAARFMEFMKADNGTTT